MIGKYREIDTKKERRICYLLLVIVVFVIASGLSTLFIAYNLGMFIIDNVSGESLQAINKVIRLKYDFIQQVGGLERYILIRTVILALAISASGVLLFSLHVRIMRILTQYDKLRAVVAQLVKEKK